MSDSAPAVRQVSLSTPAKINLFLSVGPRDNRGYHPIRTVYEAIGIWDVVTVSLDTGETEVTFSASGIPLENTVTKAIAEYARQFDLPPVSIHVIKNIPSEAGLGGGSSDAAATLRCLQRLFGSPISEPDLAGMALRVGADVPFFLVGGRARAEGYGEILTALPDMGTRNPLIALPIDGCSTGAMFRMLDGLEYEWRDFPDDDRAYNDFERVAPSACLELIARMRELGALRAGLSGSGSAVFGFFPYRMDAHAAWRKLKSEGVPVVIVAQTLKREESLNHWTTLF